MGFFRQEYWSGLPFPPPGDLPNPEIKLESPALAGSFFTTELPGKLRYIFHYISQLIKCTINVMCLNHSQTMPPPPPLRFVENFSSTKPVPGIKKAEATSLESSWWWGGCLLHCGMFSKTLMLGKVKGRRRRGWQRWQVGWHHRFNGHELGQTPEDGDGQESLACGSPWGREESDTTWRLNKKCLVALLASVH